MRADVMPVGGPGDVSSVPERIIALPKVELHVHLEGSMRPGTVAELANESGVDLPTSLAAGRWRFANFDDFMRQYSAACRVLTRREHFSRIATEFVEDAAAVGVRYAEVTFTPAGHARRVGDWHWPADAVLDAFASAGRSHGVTVAVILDHSRENPLRDAERTAELAVECRSRGVVALGLGGDEHDGGRAFKKAFAFARDHGLGSVVHAGETAGPDSIWTAIDDLGASRIGHGLTAIHDRRLLERLVADGIVLEVCPTSNVATGVVASLKRHPWPRLVAASLRVTVNSDDPAMFGTNVAREFALVRKLWGASDDDLADLTRTALAGSYAPAAVRSRVELGVAAWVSCALLASNRLAGPAPNAAATTNKEARLP
jgi:adenosine deaminase